MANVIHGNTNRDHPVGCYPLLRRAYECIFRALDFATGQTVVNSPNESLTEFSSKLLAVDEPWFVERIDRDDNAQQVVVLIAYRTDAELTFSLCRDEQRRRYGTCHRDVRNLDW